MPKSERFPLAISLFVMVTLLHLAPLLVIALSIKEFLNSPQMNAPCLMESRHALDFRGELVLPLVRYPADDLMVLKFVNLKTGTVRYSKPTRVVVFHGMVSDGNSIWVFGDKDQIYETDGQNEQTYVTAYKLSIRPTRFSGMFYDGRPAVVDRTDDEVHRLLILEDREWVERGHVAVPGRDREWTVDDRTGRQIMVPHFFDGSVDKTRWPFLHVVSDEGRYHLFQIEIQQQATGDRDPFCRIAYRHEFDFTAVSNPDASAPLSAMAPANVPPDTSGWQLLPVTVNPYFADIVMHAGDLFLAHDRDPPKILRVIPQESFATSVRIETYLLDELPNDRAGRVGLIQSADKKELFAIRHPRFGESRVYQWDGSQFVKLPIVINGLMTMIVRNARTTLLQFVGSLWIGTLVFVLCASWLTNRTGEQSYSFGTQTLFLASLVRRAMARCIDLALMLTPLAWVIVSMLRKANSQTIFELLNSGRPFEIGLSNLRTLTLVATWAVAVWLLIVISTDFFGVSPGKWICGIRVIRKTLRRCGLARSLVRELLIFLDVPLLLTAVPGIIACLSTTYRQRMGDLIADTIVIANMPSAREKSSQGEPGGVSPRILS